jgi:hypothetical protein
MIRSNHQSFGHVVIDEDSRRVFETFEISMSKMPFGLMKSLSWPILLACQGLAPNLQIVISIHKIFYPIGHFLRALSIVKIYLSPFGDSRF